MEIEIVEWLDSMGMHGWAPAEEYLATCQGPLTCWTAGFVFHEDKDRLSLALSTNEDSFHSSITIPKCAIVSRRRLSAPGRANRKSKRRQR